MTHQQNVDTVIRYLNETRNAMGLSRRELARRAGVSDHAIMHLERGAADLYTVTSVLHALDSKFSADLTVIGSRIFEKRMDMRMTLRQLGEVCGVAPVTISRLERGITATQIRLFAKICAGADLDILEVLMV